MESKELIEYIKSQINNKVSKEEITKILQEQGGWADKDITDAFLVVEQNQQNQNPEVGKVEEKKEQPEIQSEQIQKEEMSEKLKKKTIPSRLGLLIVLLAAVIVGAGALWYMNYYTESVNINEIMEQIQEELEVKNTMEISVTENYTFPESPEIPSPNTPSLSNKGDKVAFIAGKRFPYYSKNVFILDLTTKKASSLTSEGESVALPPAWSSDDKKIAYLTFGSISNESGFSDYEIWVSDLNGENKEKIHTEYSNNSEKDIVHLEWLDNNNLVFITSEGNIFDTYESWKIEISSKRVSFVTKIYEVEYINENTDRIKVFDYLGNELFAFKTTGGNENFYLPKITKDFIVFSVLGADAQKQSGEIVFTPQSTLVDDEIIFIFSRKDNDFNTAKVTPSMSVLWGGAVNICEDGHFFVFNEGTGLFRNIILVDTKTLKRQKMGRGEFPNLSKDCKMLAFIDLDEFALKIMSF